MFVEPEGCPGCGGCTCDADRHEAFDADAEDFQAEVDAEDAKEALAAKLDAEVQHEPRWAF